MNRQPFVMRINRECSKALKKTEYKFLFGVRDVIVENEEKNPFGDPRRIDWMKFGQVMTNKLSWVRNGNIGTTDEVELKVRTLKK